MYFENFLNKAAKQLVTNDNDSRNNEYSTDSTNSTLSPNGLTLFKSELNNDNETEKETVNAM